MSYITIDDIKDNLVKGVTLTDYIEECDNEINDLAELKGVRDTTSIQTAPLHYKIKRYAIAFVCYRVAQDKMGTASPDVQYDLYRDKRDDYKAELRDLFPQITYEMITGEVNSLTGRTASFNLYRA